MKILNLYAGIGGNRKLWGDSHEITAIEYDPKIAKIYQDFFPNDKVIVADAHQYLLEHYHEFDFIWSSPPCQSHTSMNVANHLSPYEEDTEKMAKQKANGGGIKPRYPKMELYQEIILLTHFFKGKWCVENVVGYYEPLIKPNNIAKHYFWTNFIVRDFKGEGRGMGKGETIETMQKLKGFDLSKYNIPNKRTILRNCVEPEVAKHILDLAINPIEIQKSIF
ncbi:MAG: DNA cytosine methyltransferase [Patescibacteria group bacterium]